MSKINYNQPKLFRDIIPNLESCISYVKKLKNITSELNIPDDFKYKAYLISLESEFEKELNELILINKKIKDSNTNFTRAENQIEMDIIDIENYLISLRQGAIK